MYGMVSVPGCFDHKSNQFRAISVPGNFRWFLHKSLFGPLFGRRFDPRSFRSWVFSVPAHFSHISVGGHFSLGTFQTQVVLVQVISEPSHFGLGSFQSSHFSSWSFRACVISVLGRSFRSHVVSIWNNFGPMTF